MKIQGSIENYCFNVMRTLQTIILIFITVASFGQVPGEVVDTVVCELNKGQSYALYLPSNYTSDKKWPIVYFFEPAARGSLPVKLYAEVAEELGYILACTHNSRNGSFDNSFKAADAIFLDTQNKLSIDYDHVTLSGFSGGSRLALSLAVISKAAYGVIGVGAAQPPIPDYMVLEKKDFKYVGLVGAKDMNYQEHKVFTTHLNSLNMDNLLLVSNLTHQWADPDDFRLALLWMQEEQAGFKTGIEDKLQLHQDSIPFSDVLNLRSLVGQDDGDAKLEKKILKEESKILKKEVQLKNAITDSMNVAFRVEKMDSPSIKWVIRRVEKLKKEKEKATSIHEQMMFDRLLNYISAICFESGMSMKSQGYYDKAFVAIEIWEAVYQNPIFAHWMRARVYAASNNHSKALDHLEETLKSGKVQKVSLYREPDFKGLRENPRFQELIATYYN